MPLDPKIVAALQAYKLATGGLVAAGVPPSGPQTGLANATQAAMIVFYEALLGQPSIK